MHTRITLEKLFGMGSFGGFIAHLVCHQTIFHASLGKFNLLFMVWIIAPTFLGC
jgi:hypothetical protein